MEWGGIGYDVVRKDVVTVMMVGGDGGKTDGENDGEEQLLTNQTKAEDQELDKDNEVDQARTPACRAA